ncbi:hypothetical protein ACFOY4_29455 [Actinomadura syzygii]|uniref:Glyoxalase/fosfomycin resistance/dioxygenase domain-containing protein n=1 Tax=Actinomadura syzygii TaxID=1427538 RepID=A0A5D0UFS5_9ACTN|nr:hypothetical protein [Actinomadura syzygii]TYC16443.1 hypothetical protein FXF65_07495 [Actinomadura syzygii]
MNLGRAAHVGISVSDLDVSIAFYKALTGREPVVADEVTRRRRSAPRSPTSTIRTAPTWRSSVPRADSPPTDV